MYAIIKTGGKQYKVKEGDIITVEKLGVDAGENFTFDEVLVVGNDGDMKFGTPLVEGASVEAEVLEEGKHKKVVVFRYKAKKGYRKKTGHRQPYTRLRVSKINN